MAESKYHYNRNIFKNPINGSDFVIYQLGELYSNENTVFSEHRQICDEISFILSGRGFFSANGKRYAVAQGDCFISFKDELHSIISSKNEPLRFYFCGFSPKSERAKQIIGKIGDKHTPCIKYGDAQAVLSQMIDEIWTERAYFTDMLNAQLMELIIRISRFLNSEYPKAKSLTASSLVYQIIMYLETHINEPDALSLLEDEFHYNYRRLSDTFSQSMGETLRSYFFRIRMERAKELLQQKKSVTEVSEILGYSSLHPFSRAYKSHFGHTPSKHYKTGTDL